VTCNIDIEVDEMNLEVNLVPKIPSSSFTNRDNNDKHLRV